MYLNINYINTFQQLLNSSANMIQFYQMVSAFSVPKAKRQQKIEKNPGPGEYNPQTSPKIVNHTDPKYSFGKDGRKNSFSKVPGPGSYQAKQDYTRDRNPSYSLGTRRNNSDISIPIGPGQYDPKYSGSKQKAPSYSLYGRNKDLQNSTKIGPGQYQIKGELQKNKSGFHFSKDTKNGNLKHEVPGPGSYQYQNAAFKYGSKQQPSYGFGSRLKQHNQSKNPGPGSYQSKQSFSRIGGIMSRELRNSFSNSKTPGPGNYQLDANKVKNKDPSWSLPQSSRDNMYKSSIIGPGSYDHDKNFKKLATYNSGYNFGSEKKLNYEVNKVPGPGNYNAQNIKSRKNIRIGQKLKDSNNSIVPGPGAYQNQKYDYQSWMKGSGRYSLGRSLRDSTDKKNVPGPGAYENSKINEGNGKITFGRDSRLKQYSNFTPGPGQYDLKPFFADVPSYLLPNKA